MALGPAHPGPVQGDDMDAELKIEILRGLPPNFEMIAKALPAARKPGTIFTYGYQIYVSDGAQLPKSIVAHEVVHVQQQAIYGRDEWWARYVTDPEFRFQMELAAHRMELSVATTEGNRKDCRRAEKLIAQRLASPLYGNACTLVKARNLLRETVDDSEAQ